MSISRRAAPAVVEGLALLLLAAGLVLPEPVCASAEPIEDLAAYEGDWRQLDPAAARLSRLTAIDRAVGGLSWVVRQMAAPVLRRTTAPPPRMQFFWKDDHLEQRVFVSGGEQRTRPVEFAAPASPGRDSRGEPMEASWQWTASGLRLNWIQDQAYGSNLYRVDPATEILVVEHTIHVTAISDVEPITFESRFARRMLPGVAADGTPDPAAP